LGRNQSVVLFRNIVLHNDEYLTGNQRFMTYYGQENAQLDRLNSPMPEDTVDRPGIRALANLILLGVPNHYYFKLRDLFVHDQVYVDQWQAFMTDCISEWRGMYSWVCH
jgi:hypothetical protein